jgi:hypothetical protein
MFATQKLHRSVQDITQIIYFMGYVSSKDQHINSENINNDIWRLLYDAVILFIVSFDTYFI